MSPRYPSPFVVTTVVLPDWGANRDLRGVRIDGEDAGGKIEEISGGEQDTTNLRMEVTATCVALETIDKGHIVTVYSDSSYLVNCMRRGWYKKWRENGWLNHRNEPVANR